MLGVVEVQEVTWTATDGVNGGGGGSSSSIVVVVVVVVV
jgi:hypothetical protein